MGSSTFEIEVERTGDINRAVENICNGTDLVSQSEEEVN